MIFRTVRRWWHNRRLRSTTTTTRGRHRAPAQRGGPR